MLLDIVVDQFVFFIKDGIANFTQMFCLWTFFWFVTFMNSSNMCFQRVSKVVALVTKKTLMGFIAIMN
jgi:hypothetical protein